MSRTRDRLLTAGTLATAAILLFAWLGSYALWDPDEGRHAEIARELHAAASWSGWIVPMHNFAPYHDKPILYYWLTSLAYSAVGVNELGARLVSATAALGTLAAIFSWTAGAWGRPTAHVAVGVLVTAVGFLGLGRYGNLDMLLACWITIGLVAAYRGALVVAAVAAALGMLTKGLVAPLFVAAVPVLHGLVVRRRLPGTPGSRRRAAVVFVAVAAPWYVVAGLRDPDYLREFFLVHHLARFTRDVTTFHAGPWWYYAPALVLVFFPWSFLLPATLVATSRSVRRDPAVAFAACWAAVVVVFFSASHGKLATYVLPALPPLAALTAHALVDAVVGPDTTPAAPRLAVWGLVAIAGVFGVGLPVAWAFAGRRHATLLAGALPALAVLPVAAAAVVVCVRRGRVAGGAAALGASVAACAVVFYARLAPLVSGFASEEALAAVIDSRPPAPIVAYDVHPASLLFYVGRPVVHVDTAAALRSALAVQPFAWVVTSPRHVAELARTSGAPVYPWHTDAHHVLYATAPPDDARS